MILLTGVVMVVVELAQGAVVEGRAFDIDDVILNTTGALLGYLLVGRRISHHYHAFATVRTEAGRSGRSGRRGHLRQPVRRTLRPEQGAAGEGGGGLLTAGRGPDPEGAGRRSGDALGQGSGGRPDLREGARGRRE